MSTSLTQSSTHAPSSNRSRSQCRSRPGVSRYWHGQFLTHVRGVTSPLFRYNSSAVSGAFVFFSPTLKEAQLLSSQRNPLLQPPSTVLPALLSFNRETDTFGSAYKPTLVLFNFPLDLAPSLNNKRRVRWNKKRIFIKCDWGKSAGWSAQETNGWTLRAQSWKWRSQNSAQRCCLSLTRCEKVKA